MSVTIMKIQNYIGGKFCDPKSGQWIDNEEPATGTVFSQVPDSGADDVEAAVNAADAANHAWARLAHDERAEYLNRIADLIDENAEELIALESQDNGKPESLAARVDIPRCSKNLRFFASLVTGFASESHAMPDGINYTLRQPLGTVGCITPWNLPLYLLTWKIGPALAVGNCVVCKPSEITPATAFRFSQICDQAGLPAGVLNVVHGSGAQTGNALTGHKRIKAISFTGGTQTGRHIASVVAPTFKKLALEMGGKNPNVIFADCDYEKTIRTTLQSSFANQGQICLCGSRVIIERPLFDKFRDDLVRRAKKMVVGDPKDAASNLGAVVSKTHYEKILAAIERAKQEGGEILCGGKPAEVGGRCEGGYFIEPTVIVGLDNQCQTNQEEIFGPVVTLQPFDTPDEAVSLANDVNYGLSASVWTQNVGLGQKIASQIDAGVVWVNCWMVRDLRTPFGGMKQSGVGREGGQEALRFWTEPKNVCVKYG